MNKAQATNAAQIEAHRFNQPMFVVQRGESFFAASSLDLSRQFAGFAPVQTINKPRPGKPSK